MRKIDFITLHADNTASMRKCKIKGTKVLASRTWKPEFTEGRSVFPLRTRHFFGLIRRTKKVVMAMEGAERCLEFEPGASKLAGSSWTMKELKDFVGKLVHLSLVTQKPFSNIQAFLLFGGVLVNIIIGILIIRRIGV